EVELPGEPGRGPADVGDEDVDAAERRERVQDGALRTLDAGEVRRVRRRRRAQPGQRGVEPRAAAAHAPDARALRGGGARRLEAEPLGGRAHDGAAPGDAEVQASGPRLALARPLGDAVVAEGRVALLERLREALAHACDELLEARLVRRERADLG